MWRNMRTTTSKRKRSGEGTGDRLRGAALAAAAMATGWKVSGEGAGGRMEGKRES